MIFRVYDLQGVYNLFYVSEKGLRKFHASLTNSDNQLTIEQIIDDLNNHEFLAVKIPN